MLPAGESPPSPGPLTAAPIAPGASVANTRLQPLTEALLEAITPAAVVATVVERGRLVLGAEAGMVVLVDDTGISLKIVGAQGYSEAVVAAWRQFPLDAPLPLSDAVREAQPLFFTNRADWKLRYPAMFQQDRPLHALKASASLPLTARGRAFGGLHFSFPEERDAFSPADQELLHDLAQQCALALDRALLLEQAERARDEAEAAREEMALLYETGRLLGQTLDLTTVYDSFQSMVERAMDCVGLVVSEYLPESEQIRCLYAWVEGARQDVTRFPLLERQQGESGGGLQSRVIRTGESLLVNDFLAHVKAHRALYYSTREGAVESTRPPDEPTTRSIMMVPLRIEGRVLGVVQVQSHAEGAYTLEQLHLLEAMTLQVAAASRNAFLFQQVNQAAQQQRRFLREMLLGFTDGRLHLCDATAELPSPLAPFTDTISLSPPTLRTFRRQVEAVAGQLGLPLERGQDMQTAADEAAMNAVRHGGGGTAQVCGSMETGTMQVWVQDAGPGIAEDMIHRAVEQGFTTGGFGQGFFLMRSCADRLYLLTGPQGTTIVLEMEKTAPLPAWLQAQPSLL